MDVRGEQKSFLGVLLQIIAVEKETTRIVCKYKDKKLEQHVSWQMSRLIVTGRRSWTRSTCGLPNTFYQVSTRWLMVGPWNFKFQLR